MTYRWEPTIPLDRWNKDKYYQDNEVVSQNEQDTEVKFYISLVGSPNGALLSPDNIGNNPSVSPAHWSLLEEIA